VFYLPAIIFIQNQAARQRWQRVVSTRPDNLDTLVIGFFAGMCYP